MIISLVEVQCNECFLESYYFHSNRIKKLLSKSWYVSKKKKVKIIMKKHHNSLSRKQFFFCCLRTAITFFFKSNDKHFIEMQKMMERTIVYNIFVVLLLTMIWCLRINCDNHWNTINLTGDMSNSKHTHKSQR